MGTTQSWGDVLSDRYAIERELGSGGMATVWLAEERKHGRKVALKVLRPELTASLGAERFLREIGISARLSHPHIVPLIDSGEANGVLYFVSPYVAGGSLRERLADEGKLPIRDALRIAHEIGLALGYAHRNGFVHRDVKPENILFADGHAVLADFGIARACAGCATEASITDAGIAVGTPEYMSPEQASGESDVGIATDIYSLACVLYEMLAGAPPFAGSNSRAAMARHVTEAPKAVRTHRPDASPAIERAIARALAKDPAERFSAISEFCEALTDDSHSRPRTSPAMRSIAVLPFVNASPDPANEYLSDGITDELINALAKVHGLRVPSRSSVFALKGKPQDVRSVGALLGASVVLEGTVRKSGERLRITAQLTSTDNGQLLWSERYDRELEDVFALQDEIASTIVNTLRATWFAELRQPSAKRPTDSVRAYGLYLRGRYAWNKRTQEGVVEAIDFFEQAIAEDPRYAHAYAGLSDSYALHVDYRSVPVTAAFARAKEYARKALEIDETVAEAHVSLAWALFIYDFEWSAAEREFRRAIELDPTYATAHQWYSMLLTSQARFEESLIEAHTSQELDPASVSIRRGVGWLYLYARRYDQALYHLGRAIEMNPFAEESHRVLGLSLALSGQLEEAERVLRAALQLPGAGTLAKSTLGYALGLLGRSDDARAILTELEQQASHDYVSPVAFAMVHLGLRDKARALDFTEKALEERRGWLVYVNVNPVFDILRDEPRFHEVVRKMKLDDRSVRLPSIAPSAQRQRSGQP